MKVGYSPLILAALLAMPSPKDVASLRMSQIMSSQLLPLVQGASTPETSNVPTPSFDEDSDQNEESPKYENPGLPDPEPKSSIVSVAC